jgi:hypothetical protein
MPRRLIITIVCFHIVAVLAVFAGVDLLLLDQMAGGIFSDMANSMKSSADQPIGDVLGNFWTFMRVIIPVAGVFFILLAIAVEAVIYGLNKRSYWAWITGIVLCGLLILSGFKIIVPILLGGLALWGLVDPDSVAAFRPSQSQLKIED